MTRSMSAAVPISSVMTVEGVSGEMAIPARMPRRWMLWIRDTGSAKRTDERGISYRNFFSPILLFSQEKGTHMLLRSGNSREHLLRLQYRPPTVDKNHSLRI